MSGWLLPDLVGRRFSAWTVLSRQAGSGATFWICRCDCGVQRSVAHCNLYRGSSTNCGCIAFKNRQLGRNLAPSSRDEAIPNESWSRFLSLNGVRVEASDMGRLRHQETGHVYSFYSEGGYWKTVIGGKIVKVHRAVAAAFHANPMCLPEVNHLDGKKKNNAPSNLEWSTHADNMRHAWRTGLISSQPGSKNPAAKLTEEKVNQIRSRYTPGLIRQADLAKEYGVSQRTISLILRRENWAHV